MNKMFELDFSGEEKEQKLSYEDQCSDGHYEMPLPLKDNNKQFPDNKEQVPIHLGKLQ